MDKQLRKPRRVRIHLLSTRIWRGRETRPAPLCGAISKKMTILLENVTCQFCLAAQKKIEASRMKESKVE